MNTEKVTRIEVIEDAKRKYVKWDCEPIFQLQDGGKTLKIFIDNSKELNEWMEDNAKEVDIEINSDVKQEDLK